MRKLKLLITFTLIFILGNVSLSAQTNQVSQKEAVIKENIQKIKSLDLQEQRLLIHPITNASFSKLEKINDSRSKLLNTVENDAIVMKEVLQKESARLYKQAQEMNQDFAAKGIARKTQIRNIGGKQYIQIVDLPKQNGVPGVKVNK